MRVAICYHGDYGDALRIRSIAGHQEQAMEGETAWPVSPTVSDSTHYIKPSTGKANLLGTSPCTPSKTTLAADGVETLVLSQMRADTQIEISGPIEDAFVATGSETLTFTMPGEYTVTATAPFPALPREIRIHAS